MCLVFDEHNGLYEKNVIKQYPFAISERFDGISLVCFLLHFILQLLMCQIRNEAV